MKNILKILILVLVTSTYANNSINEKSIKGEWKGSYVLNAYVTEINIYIFKSNSTWNALVDFPKRNTYDIPFNVTIKNNQLYLSRTNKRGILTEMKGDLSGNTISGSYQYNSDYMKDKPGLFQLMKSNANVIKGEDMPSFVIKTIDNKTITNATYKNKFVFLDFWSTGCPPCVEKRPKLELLKKKYGSKIEIISISLDKNIEIIEKFRKERFSMNWTHSIPQKWEDPIITKFVPQGLPYGYIINPQGKVVAFANELDAKVLIKTMDRVLK